MRMRRWIVAAAVAVLTIGEGARAEEKAIPAAVEIKHQATCPVMGGKIDKAVYVDFEGKRVYFCCKGCPPEFNKDPAKYIKKLEAEGITLEKTPQAATTNAPAAAPREGHGGHEADPHGAHHH